MPEDQCADKFEQREHRNRPTEVTQLLASVRQLSTVGAPCKPSAHTTLHHKDGLHFHGREVKGSIHRRRRGIGWRRRGWWRGRRSRSHFDMLLAVCGMQHQPSVAFAALECLRAKQKDEQRQQDPIAEVAREPRGPICTINRPIAADCHVGVHGGT